MTDTSRVASSKSNQIYEKVLRTETVYDGKVIRVERLDVELPEGKQTIRDVVRHRGAVAILAEPVEGSVILVDQFRTAPGQTLLELPAGKLEPNEEPRDSALRELREETGYRAHDLEEVASFYTSPGFADEKIYLYYSSKMEHGTQELDEDEYLNVRTFSRAEIMDMLTNGRIQDAKTLVGLYWWLGRGRNR